jgi:hypothetical protein
MGNLLACLAIFYLFKQVKLFVQKNRDLSLCICKGMEMGFSHVKYSEDGRKQGLFFVGVGVGVGVAT